MVDYLSRKICVEAIGLCGIDLRFYFIKATIYEEIFHTRIGIIIEGYNPK